MDFLAVDIKTMIYEEEIVDMFTEHSNQIVEFASTWGIHKYYVT